MFIQLICDGFCGLGFCEPIMLEVWRQNELCCRLKSCQCITENPVFINISVIIHGIKTILVSITIFCGVKNLIKPFQDRSHHWRIQGAIRPCPPSWFKGGGACPPFGWRRLHRLIPKGSHFADLWPLRSWKLFSFRGAKPHWPPTGSSAPWTSAGGSARRPPL